MKTAARYGAVRCGTMRAVLHHDYDCDYDCDYDGLRPRLRRHRTSPTLSRLQPSSESQSIHGLRSPSALFLVFEIDATVMASPCFCSVALHDSSCSG